MAAEVPIGTIIPFGGLVAGDSPDSKPAMIIEQSPGWLLCNGVEVSVAQFSKLHSAIGYSHGRGSGSDFRLPDLRGMFLRGVDRGRGTDPQAAQRIAPQQGASVSDSGNDGNRVGSAQLDRVGIHNHVVVDPGHSHQTGVFRHTGGPDIAGGAHGFFASDGRTSHEQTRVTTVEYPGPESRPKNIYVNYLIRAT